MLKLGHRVSKLTSRINFTKKRPTCQLTRRYFSGTGNNGDSDQNVRDEPSLLQNLGLPGVYLDEIDTIMSDEALRPLDKYYPNTVVDRTKKRTVEGHNLMVIQPWVSYSNFSESTDADLQLDECVSLGNTIKNWTVIDKRIVLATQLNRKHIIGPKAFEELKETIQSKTGVTAVFFGVELLSAVQLATLEKELKLAVYDRFTVVLNIFRQHARTKEAKLQLALAELPYIRSHLRGIHESSEYSSSTESLKILVGGVGEKVYHQRLNILKQREGRLRYLLDEVRKQREITKKQRRRCDAPTIAVVGYTNCGKTSLIKYLTQDSRLVPKDQLFATLDVSAHIGHLASSRKVFYLDTVGFVSRIPLLLIEAFSATLKDVQESDLILHLLDVTHPDHKLQHSTVIKALESLKVSKNLLESRLTIGNKADLINLTKVSAADMPKCDLNVSVVKAMNMDKLVERIDKQLMTNLRHEQRVVRIENGGKKYSWLMKNATILDCQPDQNDVNYLICRVLMSPTACGRWAKSFGVTDFIKEEKL